MTMLGLSAVTLKEVLLSSILGVRALTIFLLVTVVGQSVGAADIGLQLMAFGGEKSVPFQQAM